MPNIELLQDRRRTRYSRLRKAIAAGLEQPEALKVTRKPQVQTEAVDPELEEVAARLAKRMRR